MPFCPICEIRFRDKRGLKGHFRFKHRIEYDTGKPARDTAFTKAIGRNIDRRVSGDAMMKAMEETGERKRIAKEMEDKESKMKTKGVVFRNIGGEPTHEDEYREKRVIFRNR